MAIKCRMIETSVSVMLSIDFHVCVGEPVGSCYEDIALYGRGSYYVYAVLILHGSRARQASLSLSSIACVRRNSLAVYTDRKLIIETMFSS